MKQRVFAPLGIENVHWDRQGGGGKIGPHTNAHSGLHIAARDFARLGYMLAHGGTWRAKRLFPSGGSIWLGGVRNRFYQPMVIRSG
jgi:CubicO group peptidase (beta-lactamase class C family)